MSKRKGGEEFLLISIARSYENVPTPTPEQCSFPFPAPPLHSFSPWPAPRLPSPSTLVTSTCVRTYIRSRNVYIYIYAIRTVWLPSNQRFVISTWVVGYGTCYDCKTRLNNAIFYLGLEKRIYSTIISRVFLRKAIMVSSTRAYLAR